MKIAIIADEVHRDLGAPSDISPSAIAYWLRENIGSLNNLIYTDFELSDSGSEVSPELEENEKVILKKMYMVYHLGKKINDYLGAAGTEVITEISQDGQTVRRVNKIELSKTYIQLRKEETNELNKLVLGYKSKKAVPRQVAGDDTIAANENTRHYTTRELEE